MEFESSLSFILDPHSFAEFLSDFTNPNILEVANSTTEVEMGHGGWYIDQLDMHEAKLHGMMEDKLRRGVINRETYESFMRDMLHVENLEAHLLTQEGQRAHETKGMIAELLRDISQTYHLPAFRPH